MRRLVALSLVLLGACSGPATEPGVRRAVPVPTAAGTPAPSPAPRADPSPTPRAVPGARVLLPATARELAAEMRQLDAEVRADIRRWLERGARTAAARPIELRSLYLQRVYRQLAGNDRLSARVLRRLPPRLARHARSNIAASKALLALVGKPTKKPPKFRYARPAHPHRLRRFYRQAQRRFGIPWHVLAAVNFVESKFGRVLGPSSAGALGPMQFLPSTWEAYGGGGDILDPHDSILGAARYLRSSGAPQDMRAALFAYNRSDAYVDAILIYADEIKRDLSNFYIYYFWQVFVTTKQGDMQLTGPGAKGP